MITDRQPIKSVLRRRHSFSADAEALIDGILVILLSYLASNHYIGSFRILDLLFLLSLLAAMAVVYDTVGVYRRHEGFLKKIVRLTQAWGISLSIIVILGFATGMVDYFSRSHIVTFFVVGFIGQLVFRMGFELFQRRRLHFLNKSKALVVGDGALAHYITERINANPWLPETVIGAVTTLSNTSDVTEDHSAQVPVLGTTDDIDSILDAHEINTVYIVTTPDASPIIRKLYSSLVDRSINIHWVPNVYGLNPINLNVKELAGIPLITLSESPLSGWALLAKTLEDRLIASFALLLVSPIMIIAATAIKLDSPGPVFFFQQRTGWDGQVFSIWKFRTMMHAHTVADGIVTQATLYDPRVTRVGRFLRRTSIDEIPQLFNVLLGTMSLVGPRPHAVQHNDFYAKKINSYLSRHRIKPGITGLAQIRGFRGETKELRLMEERVKSDIEYINNWSILLDLSILFRTVRVITGSRAY